jgi:hypothetical protein
VLLFAAKRFLLPANWLVSPGEPLPLVILMLPAKRVSWMRLLSAPAPVVKVSQPQFFITVAVFEVVFLV